MLNQNQTSNNKKIYSNSRYNFVPFPLTKLLICTLAFYTFGCEKQVTFSSIPIPPEAPSTINVAQAIGTCEQVSKGRYNLDKCNSTNSQKCIDQKYGQLTCYTRVNKTCEEGGMYSTSNQCPGTNSKKCEQVEFAEKNCYHLVNKKCNEFNLYASKNVCDSRRSNIQKCESIRRNAEVTCWKTVINTELYVKEEFLQPRHNRRKVDILIVNDNSVSMYENQSKMSEKLNSFIDELKNVDWHIGITTTDLSNGQYSSNGRLLNMSDGQNITNTKFITANTPNKEELFRNTIPRPESIALENHLYCFDRREMLRRSRDEREKCKEVSSQTSSGEEQPMGAIVQAIELRNSHNIGFFRDEADLAVVILTNEDESIPKESSMRIYNPNDVISAVIDTWGPEKQLSVYGIMIEPGDSQCLDKQKEQRFEVSYANTVAGLSEITNGLTGSICDNDYGPTLKDIGEDIIDVVNQFELANTPANGTLSVHINENGNKRRLSATEYSLSNRIINLNVIVTPTTKLEVNYIPN